MSDANDADKNGRHTAAHSGTFPFVIRFSASVSLPHTSSTIVNILVEVPPSPSATSTSKWLVATHAQELRRLTQEQQGEHKNEFHNSKNCTKISNFNVTSTDACCLHVRTQAQHQYIIRFMVSIENRRTITYCYLCVIYRCVSRTLSTFISVDIIISYRNIQTQIIYIKTLKLMFRSLLGHHQLYCMCLGAELVLIWIHITKSSSPKHIQNT